MTHLPIQRLAVAVTLASSLAMAMLQVAAAPGVAASTTSPQTVKLVVIDVASGTPVISTTTVAVDQVAAVEAHLESEPAVTAFADVGATPQSVGSDGDPLRSSQWALDQMRVEGAHGAGYDGTGQIIAVIDTGIYAPHEDLGGQIVESVDMIDGLPGFRYHGTAVAGIIAANSGNRVGGSSIAPGAKLLDIRVCTPTSCDSDAILNGIVWAVQHHATVINMSLGGGSPEWAPVLSWAQAQGVVIVAAAGNAGCQLNVWNGTGYVPNQYCTAAYLNNAREWPAADPHVIAVGAMQQDGTVATYSSYGSYLDLAAPTGVLTTTPPYYDAGFAGTSAAAPHVAAVAALVRQANPTLTPADVQAVLEDSAVTPTTTPQHPMWTADLTQVDTTTINPQMLVGAGVVDAQAAVDLAHTWNARTPAPVATGGDTQLALSWPAIDGAAEYRVRVNRAVLTTTTNTSFTATGLNNHAGYVVDIEAVDSNGALLSSTKPVLATPDDTPALAAIHVAQLYTDGYSGDLVIRSDTPWSGNRILNLYRADQPGLAVASTDGMSNSPVEFFGYHQLDVSVTYYATWSDLDNHESSPSNAIVVNASSKPLAAPTHVQALADNSSVTLSWDPVDGAQSYEYYDFPTDTWTTTTATSVLETGLANARPYAANVYAKRYDDGNTNTVDSYASALVRFMPLPPPPTAPIVTTTTTGAGITVSWNAVPSATGYNIYRDDGFSFGTFPGQTSQFLAYGSYTTPGRIYHFVAQAYTYFGTWGFTEFGPMSDAVIGGTTTTTTTSTTTTSTTTTTTTTTTSTTSTTTSTTEPPTTTTTTSTVPPTTTTTTTTVPPVPPPPTRSGYWMLGADGSVAHFGDAAEFGNARAAIAVVRGDIAEHLEPTRTGRGYWIVDRFGTVRSFGDARPFGNVTPNGLLTFEAVRSLRRTPTGKGYWIFTSLGRVFARGDARYYGSPRYGTLAGVIVDAMSTPSGHGYWLVGADGGIFGYGDAHFYGSLGATRLRATVVGGVATTDGRGYVLVSRDGAVFAFGDAHARGSALGRSIAAVSRYGDGYVLVSPSGIAYSLSSFPLRGDLANRPPARPVVSIGDVT